MKYVAVTAVAIVVGVLLGGFGPRAEVRDMQERIREIEATPCTNRLGRDLALLMGQGVGRPGSEPLPFDDEPAAADGDRSPEEIASDNPAAAEMAREIDEAEAEAEEEIREAVLDGLSDEEELEAFRTALELRRAQARAALGEQVDPDDDQWEAIDGAVEQMNDTLIGLGEELTGIIASGEDPTRRDAMEFTADALDALLDAEDQMRGALDDEQLADLDDEALDPFSYIDPELIDVLMELGELE
jgi:hypothetical protein